MKHFIQILFFIFTWFWASATPVLTKTVLQNYSVSFPTTENQKLESEVKIGISNLARSGINETINAFFQPELFSLSDQDKNGNCFAQKFQKFALKNEEIASQISKKEKWLLLENRACEIVWAADVNGGQERLKTWNNFNEAFAIGSLSITAVDEVAKKLGSKYNIINNVEEFDDVARELNSKIVVVKGAGNWASAIGKNIDEIVEAPLGYQIFTKNGSKYIRRIDVSDINTPRLMVDETGNIVKYTKPQRLANSTKLRSNLESNLGVTAPANHQAHHIVPSNVVENSVLHKEAMKRGLYDVDRAGNGKFLAETDEDFVALSEAYPTHFGSHPNYDVQIRKQIDDVLRSNNLNTSSDLSKLSNQQITNMIDDIEDLSLNILENWKPSKLN